VPTGPIRFERLSPKLLRAAVPSVPNAAPKPVPLEVFGGVLAFGELEPVKPLSRAPKPGLLELLGTLGVACEDELELPRDMPILPSYPTC
jgi:hypothetical protein